MFSTYSSIFIICMVISGSVTSQAVYCRYKESSLLKYLKNDGSTNQVCITDLSKPSERSGFIATVPFNQEWADNTLQTLTAAFKQYGFVNKVRNAGTHIIYFNLMYLTYKKYIIKVNHIRPRLIFFRSSLILLTPLTHLTGYFNLLW